MPVELFDTTLRDGAQSEGVSFTAEDKLKIARLLDAVGIDYIEGGWPGSNPKDIEFFKKAKQLNLKRAKLVAFGSTRRAKVKVESDANIQALLEAKTPAIAIFGKSWDFHVTHALKIKLEENLKLIDDSIRYLKSKGKEVLYDAEHFFDGYKKNQPYALQTLKTAAAAGADVLVLCDTNGGTMTREIEEIITAIKNEVEIPLGIHTHNDGGMAVANSVMAVKCGVTHVQGTINGYGERCGNADLCSIIPALKLKMGIDCVTDKQLKELTELAHHVSEIANLTPFAHQPYVGRSAFTHKGGIHVSAVLKHPETYEHIVPELVGNERRVTVSELSGLSNLTYKAKEYGIDVTKDKPEAKALLKKLKELEHQGYSFEEGEASFELLVKRALEKAKKYFDLESFRIVTEKQGAKNMTVEAGIRILTEGKSVHSVAAGDGPVNALDKAIRRALEKHYPNLKQMRLTDYKVRVLDSEEGTAAKVRVIVESCDEKKSWGTVGVSTNIIEASWLALVDSIEYKLMIDGK